MLKNITKAAAALMVVVLLLVLVAVPTLAADLRSANTVTIASGEVVNDDLYISATDIIINGTVNGDVYAGATSVTINGTVNGGVTIGAQLINVNGEITGGARLGANGVNINGDIGGDLLIGGSMVYINSSASIGRDLLFGAGSAVVNAPVGGYIKGGGDDITLTSTVGENVEVMVQRLTVSSTADIQGNLIYISDNQADISAGANIGGNTIHRFPDTDGTGTVTPPGPFADIVPRLLAFLMALLVGVVIVLIAPGRTNAIAKAIRNKPWASLGWGAILLIGTPIAVVLAFITIVGIPLGFIGIALYVIAIYLSQIMVGLFIGRWIISYFREVESRGILVGALTLGLAIYCLLRMIPYVGFFITLIGALLGLGALLVSEKVLHSEA